MMTSPYVLSPRAVSRMCPVHEHPCSVPLRAKPAGLAARSCQRRRILAQVAVPRGGVHRASSSQFAARDPSRSPHTLQPWVNPPCPGRSETSQTSITVEGPFGPVCRRLNPSTVLSQHHTLSDCVAPLRNEGDGQVCLRQSPDDQQVWAPRPHIVSADRNQSRANRVRADIHRSCGIVVTRQISHDREAAVFGVCNHLFKRFAKRSRATGRVECDDLRSRGRNQINILPARGDVHVTAGVSFLPNTDEWKSHGTEDSRDIPRPLGPDTHRTGPLRRDRHHFHDVRISKRAYLRRLARDHDTSTNRKAVCTKAHHCVPLVKDLTSGAKRSMSAPSRCRRRTAPSSEVPRDVTRVAEGYSVRTVCSSEGSSRSDAWAMPPTTDHSKLVSKPDRRAAAHTASPTMRPAPPQPRRATASPSRASPATLGAKVAMRAVGESTLATRAEKFSIGPNAR